MGSGRRLAVIVSVAFAAALASGCESSSQETEGAPPEPARTAVGDLASLVAEDADFYSEIALELDTETKTQLGKVLTRLGGRPASIVEARDGVLARLTRELPFDRVPRWEEDVAPWVGDRAAIFGDAGPRGGEASRTTAVSVADPDAAEATLERLLASDLEVAEPDGLRLFATDSASAVALSDDVLLLGERAAVEDAALAIGAGSSVGLDEDPSFRDALADLEPEDDVSELGFVVTSSAERFERGLLRGLGDGLAEQLGDDPLARFGLDADKPVTFEFGVSEGEAVFDFSYGPSRDPGLDRLRELADGVPGGPLLLVEPILTPAIWESFKAGSKLSIDRVAEEQGLTGAEVEQILGYDPAAVLDSVDGDFALYSTFDDDRGLALGISGSTDGKIGSGDAVDFVETIATAPPSPGTTTPFDVGPSGEAIRIESERLPFPAVFAQYPERIELALGTTTDILERATDRGRRNINTYGLIDADTDIGGDYLALGYANLPSLSLYADILAPELGFPDIAYRQDGFVIVGGIYDEERDRTALRVRIDPPKLPAGSGPLDELGESPESLTSAPAADATVLASGR